MAELCHQQYPFNETSHQESTQTYDKGDMINRDETTDFKAKITSAFEQKEKLEEVLK